MVAVVLRSVTSSSGAVTLAQPVLEFGAIPAVEGADAAALAGLVLSTCVGTMAPTEAPDTALILPTHPIHGNPIALLPASGSAITLRPVADTGSIAAIEGADVFAGVALASIIGPLVGQEAADTVAFVGAIGQVGVLASIEGSDAFAAVGGDSLAAIEGADYTNYFGLADGFSVPVYDITTVAEVSWSVAVTAQETGDSNVAHVGIAWRASIAAHEAADIAAFSELTHGTAVIRATEAPDVMKAPALLGATWPQVVDTQLSAQEAPDEHVALGYEGIIWQLEVEGIGADTLYHAASPLERAMADVEVAHMMGLQARLITDNLDPWKVQSGTNLVTLAYGMGVTLWEPNWSETTQRAWIAEQWLFKSLVGTYPAYTMALGASGYDITDYITPPGGFYVSPDLTATEMNAWIAQMPQIRIKFESNIGIEGVDEMFAQPDTGTPTFGVMGTIEGADGAYVDGGYSGSTLSLHSVPPEGNAILWPTGPIPAALMVAIEGADGCAAVGGAFIDDGNSYYDSSAIGLNDGPELYGNVAVLRQADGTEQPLEMWNVVDTTLPVAEQNYEQLSLPTIGTNDFFIDNDYIDDAVSQYAFPDPAINSLYSFIIDIANVTTPILAMTPLQIGLKPLVPSFSIESDTEYDLAPSCFAGDFSENIEYMTPDDGGSLLAHQLYLFDPTVIAPLDAGISYADDARMGVPSDYAELMIDTHTLLPFDAFNLDQSYIDDGYMMPEDLSDFDQACRAVVAAQALRDTIMISLAPRRLVEFGDTFDTTVTAETFVEAAL